MDKKACIEFLQNEGYEITKKQKKTKEKKTEETENEKYGRFLKNAIWDGNFKRFWNLIKKHGTEILKTQGAQNAAIVACTRGKHDISGNRYSDYIDEPEEYLKIVKYLLDNDVDVNYSDTPDNLNYSLLTYASMYGSYDIINELIKRGANPTHIDGTGKMPIDWAIARRHIKCIVCFVNETNINEIVERIIKKNKCNIMNPLVTLDFIRDTNVVLMSIVNDIINKGFPFNPRIKNESGHDLIYIANENSRFNLAKFFSDNYPA
jgi:ankyrin repeat protein